MASTQPSPRPCRACGSPTASGTYRAREMMFGTREEFDYFQCADCGCLQIAEVPADLSRHYGPAYGSFVEPASQTAGGPLGWLRRARNRRAFTGRGALGRLVQRLKPYPVEGSGGWLVRNGVTPRSRILDVGCGSGALLLDLQLAGFQDLLGVDPFIAQEIRYPGGVRVLKQTLEETTGTFDVIMFHHVLEHVPDPGATLAAAARLLAPGGFCLVRIPVADSEAWETYRERWVQLDPPRHLTVHTVRSLERVAAGAGLAVQAVEHDSTAFQFAASELYLRDVPLVEQAGRTPPERMREHQARARALNRAGRGDQAAFYLVHAGEAAPAAPRA